jgi:hypothetical protein
MIRAMQLISPAPPRGTPGRAAFITGSAVGLFLLVAGFALGWFLLTTSFAPHFTPAGRPEVGQVAVGILAWALTFVAPAALLISGAARLAGVFDAAAARRPRATPASKLVASLGDEYVVAMHVRMPEGRSIPELVIGPFGAAVIEELPPARVTRHRGASWEVRTARGWAPYENPVDRAARDAERVRRWFAHDDRDFIVKVYSAVVGSDVTVERNASCAVITPDQIPGWLLSLPAQRSLTPSRRERIAELLRAMA